MNFLYRASGYPLNSSPTAEAEGCGVSLLSLPRMAAVPPQAAGAWLARKAALREEGPANRPQTVPNSLGSIAYSRIRQPKTCHFHDNNEPLHR